MEFSDETATFQVELRLVPGVTREEVSSALSNALVGLKADEALQHLVTAELIASGIDKITVDAVVKEILASDSVFVVAPPREALFEDPVVVIVGGWIGIQAASYVTKKIFDLVWERVVVPVFRRKIPDQPILSAADRASEVGRPDKGAG